MTTTAETCVPTGRYGLAQAARMEWIKLRSLRSTWWTLAVTAAGTVGIGGAVGLNSRNASEDLTSNALAGVVPGLLLAGALGVLTMTSEYSSGTIRATLAAIPRRPLVLAAKAAVFGGVTLVVGRGRVVHRVPGRGERGPESQLNIMHIIGTAGTWANLTS
jgi:ABC-2 type transport system permease protein